MKKNAFTLIEILVTLTITGLIFAFGYVSFRDFSRRQALLGIVRQVKGDLRFAQQAAISGDKPSDPECSSSTVLTGYNFRVVSPTNYTIEAVCAGATGGSVQIKSVDLTSSETGIASSRNPILFKSLGQGTNITSGAPDNGSVTILLSQASTGNILMVTVNLGGEIN